MDFCSKFQISRVGNVRRGEDGADWNTVKIPGPGHHDKVLDTSWILTNLSSSATYECIIQVDLFLAHSIMFIF